MPYYEKIKEYNNLEQRDIWEYDLDLTQEQIDRLVLHAFELKDSYSDYFFFKENCSYNILWLLEVARYDLNLVSHFIFKTVPLDSIKILKPYNLIKDSRFRYSNMRKMKNILEEKIENKEHLKTYVNGILVSTLSYTGAPISCSGLLIGRGFYGGTLNYAGRVGFVRYYNRALSAAELTRNFEALRGRYGL